MDAAEESSVERPDTVGGEEEHAAVVLQGAEEDGDEAVARNILCATALEIDIGFIKQDKSSITLAQLEKVAEVVLDTERIDAQVTACETDERPVGQFGNTLSGASLANARRAVEEEDASFALVADEIIAPRGDLAVDASGILTNEGLDSHLDIIIQDEILESLLVGFDGAEIGNVEISPTTSAKDESRDCLAENMEEDIAVWRGIAQRIKVFESIVRTIMLLRSIFSADSAATSWQILRKMVFVGYTLSYTAAGGMRISSSFPVRRGIKELVEARGITDDTTIHEASWATGQSIAGTRVDKQAFIFHICRTLEELPVQLAFCDEFLTHLDATLSSKIFFPKDCGNH